MKFSKENGWFSKPKRLGDPIIILNGEFTNEIGFKQALRISDNRILVYFPRTKTTGHLMEFEFGRQAVCYTGDQVLHYDKKNIKE